MEQVKTITLGAQGWYETPEALAKAVPIGENGWWAVIGSTDTIWVWDGDSSAWKDTFTATELGDYYTREQIDSKLAGKAASSHKHTKSDITDFPSSLPASDVYSWAKQSTKPGYDFSEINGNVINTEPSTSNHKIILGTQGLNQCEFFEYGGIWNFYKMNPSQELVASIQGDGFHGNVNGKADTAGTADKLGTDAGSATQPVCFAGGKPVACTYTLGKSVPSNAVFTDTTYAAATSSALGLVKIGSNITNSSGTISLTKANIIAALGYTPSNGSGGDDMAARVVWTSAITISSSSYTTTAITAVNYIDVIHESVGSSSGPGGGVASDYGHCKVFRGYSGYRPGIGTISFASGGTITFPQLSTPTTVTIVGYQNV